MNDVRLAVRQLRQHRGFATLVVLTLALGIGANTAVFSVVHAVLLNPLPFTDPDRVLVLGEFTPSVDTRFVSPVTYDDWSRRNDVFATLAAFRYWQTVNLEDGTGDPQPIDLVTATPSYFDAIGARPLVGRIYKEEQTKGGGTEAVLSHEFWMRRYAGDRGVLGKVIRIRGAAATIVGVMPPVAADLSIGWGDVWTCLYRYNIQEQRATKYRSRYLTVVGRLKPDVTVAQARDRMTSLQHQLWKEDSSVASGYEVRLDKLAETLTGRVRQALFVQLAGVIIVLLVACANVANLMLARAADRRSETAVRLALGASRRRLFGTLLAESVLLAVAGGVLGIALASSALAALQWFQADIPRVAEASINVPALSFALLITILAAILSSLAPLVELRRADLQTVLRQGGRTGTQAPHRVRRFLVAAQTAFACLLLISGGLLLRSFQNVLRVDPGFRPGGALVFDLFLPNTRYPSEAHCTQFYRDLMRRLEEVPGVQSAGGLLYFPFKPKLWLSSVWFERDPRPEGQEPVVYYNEVAGDYFGAMGIPLKAGRLPTAIELWEAPRVVVINETMARRLFPGRSALGERMKTGTDGRWLEIVGIVGDVRQKSLDVPPLPEFYTTFAGMPMPFFTVVARTDRDPQTMLRQVRQLVRDLDGGLAVANLQSLDAYVHSRVGERRFAVAVLGLFAALALILGGIGVYGVLSHSVVRRRREIGVRLALGATPARVGRSVVAESAGLVAGGLVLGIIAAAFASRLLGRLLFDVRPFDPVTYGAVTLLLLGIAIVAAWWPSRSAARTDALIAMRDE
jgi:putative ABC transport system permease protein